jgi:hypothetical protein
MVAPVGVEFFFGDCRVAFDEYGNFDQILLSRHC